jgi:glycosyltransferase involved in cell wall biosynthesis
VPCSKNKELLTAYGVRKDSVHVVLGGFSPSLLSVSASEKSRDVCIVGGIYERKRPDLILNVIRENPQLEFLIIGPDPQGVDNRGICWSNSSYMPILNKLDNVKVVECDYKDYHQLMASCKSYLMLSDIEGGPLGLIEAMAIGLVPVCTDTGFVVDLLKGELSSFILPLNPKSDQVSDVLNQALATFKTELISESIIRDKVSAYTWEAFAEHAFQILKFRHGPLGCIAEDNLFYLRLHRRLLGLFAAARRKPEPKIDYLAYSRYFQNLLESKSALEDEPAETQFRLTATLQKLAYQLWLLCKDWPEAPTN